MTTLLYFNSDEYRFVKFMFVFISKALVVKSMRRIYRANNRHPDGFMQTKGSEATAAQANTT